MTLASNSSILSWNSIEKRHRNNSNEKYLTATEARVSFELVWYHEFPQGWEWIASWLLYDFLLVSWMCTKFPPEYLAIMRLLFKKGKPSEDMCALIWLCLLIPVHVEDFNIEGSCLAFSSASGSATTQSPFLTESPSDRACFQLKDWKLKGGIQTGLTEGCAPHDEWALHYFSAFCSLH